MVVVMVMKREQWGYMGVEGMDRLPREEGDLCVELDPGSRGLGLGFVLVGVLVLVVLLRLMIACVRAGVCRSGCVIRNMLHPTDSGSMLRLSFGIWFHASIVARSPSLTTFSRGVKAIHTRRRLVSCVHLWHLSCMSLGLLDSMPLRLFRLELLLLYRQLSRLRFQFTGLLLQFGGLFLQLRRFLTLFGRHLFGGEVLPLRRAEFISVTIRKLEVRDVPVRRVVRESTLHCRVPRQQIVQVHACAEHQPFAVCLGSHRCFFRLVARIATAVAAARRLGDSNYRRV